jgi:hypothetical protein
VGTLDLITKVKAQASLGQFWLLILKPEFFRTAEDCYQIPQSPTGKPVESFVSGYRVLLA